MSKDRQRRYHGWTALCVVRPFLSTLTHSLASTLTTHRIMFTPPRSTNTIIITRIPTPALPTLPLLLHTTIRVLHTMATGAPLIIINNILIMQPKSHLLTTVTLEERTMDGSTETLVKHEDPQSQVVQAPWTFIHRLTQVSYLLTVGHQAPPTIHQEVPTTLRSTDSQVSPKVAKRSIRLPRRSLPCRESV